MIVAFIICLALAYGLWRLMVFYHEYLERQDIHRVANRLMVYIPKLPNETDKEYIDRVTEYVLKG
jgi:hypothetical protein